MKIENLVSKIRQREVKAVDVVSQALDRAEKSQKDLNAFITICRQEALKRAEELDSKITRGESVGRLAGVPITIKDALLTKGVRTTAASKILENYVPPYSATVVERLEAEGAIVIGKSNMDEFAMGASNENSAYGPVRNPWDVTRVPGGSSGGSAAAVAAGITPVAIGTDTGGSIREPAHFCGIVGIKPTYGRVSWYGVVAFASSLDQVGPMGATVKDSALVLEVIAGKDKRDSTSAEKPVEKWSEIKPESLKGLRIGLPREYFAEGLSNDVK
jgi:aspartyl-tRNA(Asn)/glutamyl-tRNA(Gln) amidotransferase subunit A